MNRKEHTQQLLMSYKGETDEDARLEIENEIILLNEALSATIVWRFRDMPIESEDAMQIARVAMMKSIRSFDGVHQFSTHVVTLIRNDLINTWKKTTRQKYVPLHSFVSMDAPLPDGSLFSDIMAGEGDIEHETEERMLIREILKEAPNLLSNKEYQVFLDDVKHAGTKTRDAIAAEMGITTQYVSLLKKNAYRRIRERFASEVV